MKSLEYALQEKVDKLAAVLNELEKTKADSLGANHLLGVEEERNKELEDEIDELTYNLTSKTTEAENLHERVKFLEDELDKATKRFKSIQVVAFSNCLILGLSIIDICYEEKDLMKPLFVFFNLIVVCFSTGICNQ